jgi:hypothetical protein
LSAGSDSDKFEKELRGRNESARLLMSDSDFQQIDQLEKDLQAIAQLVRATASQHSGECLHLLDLLRLLENLHQEIRDTLFQNSLPDNRQALYHLLREIEANGGWPYIHRMKLQALLKNYLNASDSELLAMLTDGVTTPHLSAPKSES